MADFLQKYMMSVGQSFQIDSSQANIVAYDFTNDSPFDVDIAWGINQPVGLTVPPFTLWRGVQPQSALLISGNKWNGIVVATPSFPGGGTPPNQAPAQQFTVHGYQKGNEPEEQVISLNRLQNIGNQLSVTATSALINDVSPLVSEVIEVTPVGGLGQTWLGKNDGSLTISGESNGALAAILETLPGGAATLAQVLMDNGLIASDGQGGMTFNHTVTINTFSLTISHTVSGETSFILLPFFSTAIRWQVRGRSSDGSMDFFENSAGVVPLRLFDTGALETGGPVNLQTGNQETGHYFTQFVAPSVVAWNFWVPFKQVMKNVPSSITLSGTTNVNCTPTVGGITKYGFRLILTPTGAGTVSCDTDWVTVGN